jgi:hypothetical protein
MPEIDITQLVNFLKKLHLFRGLKDDQLVAVAREFEALQLCTETETIVRQGETGDALYLIYNGKVTVNAWERRKGQLDTKILATLITGDYFGEEALVTRQKRSATIVAEKGTQLLKLSVQNYKNLVKQFPQMRNNFNIVVRSRRLARRLKFTWLQPNEIIYYLAGRHPITLLSWIALPSVMFILLIFIASLIESIYARPWITMFFGFLLLVNLLWFIWQWIDWSNDYYMVTNDRVVRTEKIIALYDSREEAPLGTIISVNVNSAGFFQRWIGLGDVVVRTFTTQITMYDVSYPNQVEAMVMEYWNRTKEKITSSQKDVIKKALREKIYPPPSKPIDEKPPAPEPKRESYATTLYQMLFANFLRVRFEDSNVVTYRKHWFVLLRDTFTQFVLFILLLLAPVLWANFLGGLMPLSGGSIWTVLLLLVLGWWLYDYVDWVNDVYKVTPDQIIDIYKKPLGKEQRKSAQLENIMSTSSERRGILGLLLNYGTVRIKVGVEVFDFTDVFDPPQVEQDIIRRIASRKNKKAEADKIAEAELMGNWLANYHQISRELDNNE